MSGRPKVNLGLDLLDAAASLSTGNSAVAGFLFIGVGHFARSEREGRAGTKYRRHRPRLPWGLSRRPRRTFANVKVIWLPFDGQSAFGERLSGRLGDRPKAVLPV
jgi:hypothetical protein